MALDEHQCLVIDSDTMGKDEDIGQVLMRGFFETMRATGDVPARIFFLNSGVKLTTIDGDLIPFLQEIATMGTEIFSCGTCLKHYGLEEKLLVGFRGSTDILLDSLSAFDKTVWI
jgi:selenium metabolism protein YedF